MARFVALEPPDPSHDGAFVKARLVRDGFTFLGFIVPPVWLLWNGLFIEAALAFAFVLGLAALAEWLGLGPLGSLLSILFSVYIGLEGPALLIASLRRRGWREVAAFDADGREDAEIRFAAFAGRMGSISRAEEPSDRAAPANAPAGSPRTTSPGPALGLLSYPGRG